MAKADHLDGVAPSGQHLLRSLGPQPCDQAGDFARADVERGGDGAAMRRDRLHLRSEAVMEGVHASPPFFFFLLAARASSRACAAASDSRTLTRSGNRKSTTVTSRDKSFLS